MFDHAAANYTPLFENERLLTSPYPLKSPNSRIACCDLISYILTTPFLRPTANTNPSGWNSIE
jgi:hypothetical protein